MATTTGGSGPDRLRGTSANDILRGLAGNDTLFGLSGHDRLDGGAGADRMFGGAGNDVYLVDRASDRAVESAGQGIDLVRASIGFRLGANVENLTLVGGAAINGIGNSLNNQMIGNAAANLLRGLDGADDLRGLGGNDRLEGGRGNDRLDGGLGSDLLLGQAGDDTYVVDSARDVVVEVAGGGTDLIRSLRSFNLVTTPAVEKLTLLGTADLNGTGNGLANVITGSNARNTLTGADGDDALLGNGGADRLVGGAGSDYLDGGTGVDTMSGGDGNDVYVADSGGDVVVEAAGGGSDLVRSLVTFDLSTAPEVENLSLLGAANIDGAGNDKANDLVGNSGNNTLTGGEGRDRLFGGPGIDVLIGGIAQDFLQGDAGADVYRFNTAAEGDSDVVAFMQADVDRIRLQFDADATTPIVKDPFAFIGTAGFTAPGQIRYVFSGDLTQVFASTDNDTDPEFGLILLGNITLTATDFGL